MTDSFEQRLRDAARAAPTPDPPNALIERVVDERSRGRRIALPVEGNRRRSRMWLGGAATAAAIAAALVAVVTSRSRVAAPVDHSFTSSGGFFVATAFAEGTPTSTSIPQLTAVDGMQIVPRTYEYRIQYVDSTGKVTPDGGGSVAVSAAMVGEAPAWRVILLAEQTEEGGQRRVASETLFVSRRDLANLTRVVHVRPYRRYSALNIAQRFAGDSVLGEMTTDGGVRRPIARRLPAQFGPFISDALAPLGLVGVPLSPGWNRRVSVLGWAVVPNDVFYPSSLRVIGEERISTPTGEFDCWKLDVTAGKQRRTEWVRKSDGVGLRSVDHALTDKGQRQYVLLNP